MLKLLHLQLLLLLELKLLLLLQNGGVPSGGDELSLLLHILRILTEGLGSGGGIRLRRQSTASLDESNLRVDPFRSSVLSDESLTLSDNLCRSASVPQRSQRESQG